MADKPLYPVKEFKINDNNTPREDRSETFNCFMHETNSNIDFYSTFQPKKSILKNGRSKSKSKSISKSRKRVTFNEQKNS